MFVKIYTAKTNNTSLSRWLGDWYRAQISVWCSSLRLHLHGVSYIWRLQHKVKTTRELHTHNRTVSVVVSGFPVRELVTQGVQLANGLGQLARVRARAYNGGLGRSPKRGPDAQVKRSGGKALWSWKISSFWVCKGKGKFEYFFGTLQNYTVCVCACDL